MSNTNWDASKSLNRDDLESANTLTNALKCQVCVILNRCDGQLSGVSIQRNARNVKNVRNERNVTQLTELT